MVPLTGRLVLPDPLGNGRPAPRWRCPGHPPPTTLGPRVLRTPLDVIPIPRHPTKGWLRERWQVLPQRQEATPPLLPLTRISSGGLRSEPLHQNLEDQKTGAICGPSKDVHLQPQGDASRPKPGPATLCSTISSPQQLDQGPIIRKLSRDG